MSSLKYAAVMGYLHRLYEIGLILQKHLAARAKLLPAEEVLVISLYTELFANELTLFYEGPTSNLGVEAYCSQRIHEIEAKIKTRMAEANAHRGITGAEVDQRYKLLGGLAFILYLRNLVGRHSDDSIAKFMVDSQQYYAAFTALAQSHIDMLVELNQEDEIPEGIRELVGAGNIHQTLLGLMPKTDE